MKQYMLTALKLFAAAMKRPQSYIRYAVAAGHNVNKHWACEKTFFFNCYLWNI